MEDIRKPLVALVSLLLLCALAFVMTASSGRRSARQDVAVSSQSDAVVPPSPAIMEYLAHSDGFQYLISYTDNGFEPQNLTIKKGEIVRFTNNSHGGLWVASTGEAGTIYPGTGKECGQSSFDSCKILNPGEFWEFAFKASGTWSFRNNSDTAKTAIVTVTVQ